MNISEEVRKGQAVYSKLLLSIYDVWVLWFSNSYIWKCPSRYLLEHYNKNVSSDHLDIGVGTGYFLDKCTFPSERVRLALLDLNLNSLEATYKRVQRYQPKCYQGNILEKVDIEVQAFDSISMNYLLHCLPGSLSKKLIALGNVHHLLAKGGRIFGATILSAGVKKSRMATRLMDFYNKKGVFNNTTDCYKDLENYLSQHYSAYTIRMRGCVALFEAVL